MLKKINWKKVLLTIAKFTWRFSCRFLSIAFAFVVGFVQGVLEFEPKPVNGRNRLYMQDKLFEDAPFSGAENMYGPFASSYDHQDRLYDQDDVI